MSMPVPYRYELDLTGTDQNNLVLGEIHVLDNKKIRSIAPTYGPYYAESLKVYDHVTQQLLNRDTDYSCLDIVGLPTAQSGKEIASIIVIKNQAVNNQVRLEYQALGGGYARAFDSIKKMMDNLTQDNRPAEWPNVLNRPIDFEPTMHLHRLGDIINFQYLVSAVEQLRNTILLGDQLGHDQVLAYVDYNIDILRQLINDAQNASTIIALARATDANNAAVTALQAALEQGTKSDVIETKANQSLAIGNQLLRNIQDSETNAQQLLTEYAYLFNLQSVANLNFIPNYAINLPLTFPLSESHGIERRDYYAIDHTGRVIIGSDMDFDPDENSDLIFFLELVSFKNPITGRAQIKLRIDLFDQRNGLGEGYYGEDGLLTLHPFHFINESGLPLVYAGYNEYVHSEAPYDGNLLGIYYGIQGIDAEPTHDLKVPPSEMLTVANILANHLLDHRPDFNVDNYGSVTQRKSIQFKLNPGSELSFTFDLYGNDLEQIRKQLVLTCLQRFTIKHSALVDEVLVTTEVARDIDLDKVRALSVRFN